MLRKQKKGFILSSPQAKDILIAQWEPVTRLPPAQVRDLREEYIRISTPALFQRCADSLLEATRPKARDLLVRKLNSFHMHHILPLCFGGTNGRNNLVLVEPDFHLRLHHFMTPFGKNHGESLTGQLFTLPVPRHPKKALVWGLVPTEIHVLPVLAA